VRLKKKDKLTGNPDNTETHAAQEAAATVLFAVFEQLSIFS
jgi:hypothetical protein